MRPVDKQKVVTMQELLVSSLAQTDALCKLLIGKDLITEAEFIQKLPAEWGIHANPFSLADILAQHRTVYPELYKAISRHAESAKVSKSRVVEDAIRLGGVSPVESRSITPQVPCSKATDGGLWYEVYGYAVEFFGGSENSFRIASLGWPSRSRSMPHMAATSSR